MTEVLYPQQSHICVTLTPYHLNALLVEKERYFKKYDSVIPEKIKENPAFRKDEDE
jgi:hypothetical protein